METLFNLFLWAVAGALLLGPLGAGYAWGINVSVVWCRRADIPSLRDAETGSVLGGGVLLAVLGFLAGAVVGWFDPSVEQGWQRLLTVAGVVGALMLAALLLGWVSLYWNWLGLRYTGPLLSVVITTGLAAVLAWRLGVEPSHALLGWLSAGGLTAVVVTTLRLLFPVEPLVPRAPADGVLSRERDDADD